MQKTLLTLALVVSIRLLGFGQATFDIYADTIFQGCPPDSSALYLYADSLKSNAYTWDTLQYHTIPVGGTTINMTDDQVQGPFSVGFEVSWFCGSYTQFYICSNGWIGFQNSTTTWQPVAIPSTAGTVPKNAVMGVWRDWNPGVGGGPYVSYQTLGTAPNRKLVVTWSSVPMYSCTSTYGTFQIVVHETSNLIHTNITNVPVCMAWASGLGVHGVHNPAGTYGVAITGRNATAFTASNESLRFIPDSPIVWKYANGQTIGIGNELFANITQSQYVYAYGTKCDNSQVMDSVFIVSSCIKLVMDSLNIDCTGEATGMAIAHDTSSAMSAPYTYTWKNAAGTTIAVHTNSMSEYDTLFNVPAGKYTVMASSAGEFAVGEVWVSEPDTITANTIATAVKCFGEANGKAVAIDANNYTGLSWDGFYSYLWKKGGTVVSTTTNTNVNTDTISGLTAGTYNVTVDGCLIQVGQVVVTQPTVLTASIINPTKTSCPGVTFCDASGTAVGGGGTPPYYYVWSSSEFSQTATTLCPGMNYVTVSDVNGCDTTAQVFIPIPDSIVTLSFGDTLICITNQAAIAATSTGGTPPYTYVWTEDTLTGPVVSLSSTDIVTPHVTTRYYVSSTDANGCKGDTASVVIRVRPPLGLDIPKSDTICPYDTVPITVYGTGGDSIYTYAWETGVFGQVAFVSPDLPYWYHVTVSDLCGTPAYHDSVYVQVGGYSKIDANIQLENDSICVGKNLYLIASGRGGWRGPDEYQYAWSVGGWENKSIQFDKPTQTTMYVVTITDLCLSPAGVDTAYIHVGHPAYPEIKALPNTSCGEVTAMLSLSQSSPLHNYLWTLDDNGVLFQDERDYMPYQFTKAGCYDVMLDIVTEFGCSSTVKAPCVVKILKTPTADFSNTPDAPNTIDPVLIFKNTSISASAIEWYFNGADFGSSDMVSYGFADTGFHKVTLIAESSDGCLDTVTREFNNKLIPVWHIPTSFTPNGDGLNDEFKIVGLGVSAEGFEFAIFNRWGQQVFYSKNPDFGWDGKELATGKPVSSGTFAYVLKYTDADGLAKQVAGNIVVSATGEAGSLK